MFCTAVLDDYQALSDLLFKEYEFRISADVLMGIEVGILLDLLYRTDKNTEMFEKTGEFRDRMWNNPYIMWPKNLAVFNRTLFYDEEYTKLSMPASTRCGDIYDTRILSKGLSDRFYMTIMPKVLKYLPVITLLDIVYRTNDNTRHFLDIKKKYFMKLQDMINETYR